MWGVRPSVCVSVFATCVRRRGIPPRGESDPRRLLAGASSNTNLNTKYKIRITKYKTKICKFFLLFKRGECLRQSAASWLPLETA